MIEFYLILFFLANALCYWLGGFLGAYYFFPFLEKKMGPWGLIVAIVLLIFGFALGLFGAYKLDKERSKNKEPLVCAVPYKNGFYEAHIQQSKNVFISPSFGNFTRRAASHDSVQKFAGFGSEAFIVPSQLFDGNFALSPFIAPLSPNLGISTDNTRA